MYRLVFILALLLSGCASVTYTTKDGEKLTYSRVGAQSIQGLEIVRNKNGITKVKVSRNVASAKDIGEMVANLADVASKMPTQ